MFQTSFSIVHALPHRARLQFETDPNSNINLESVLDLLRASPGILSASGNPRTKRLLVTFQGTQHDLSSLLHEVLIQIQKAQSQFQSGQIELFGEGERSWHQLPSTSVLQALGTSDQGIFENEVPARRLFWGSNQFRQSLGKSPHSILMSQFGGLPVTVLVISAVVSAISGGIADALAIGSVLLINAGIGFITELSNQRTLLGMQEMPPTEVEVIRNGSQRRISAIELVPGDQVLLQAGDTVPADIRLLNSEAMSVDEAVLTGESEPTLKTPEFLMDLSSPLAERANMAYAMTQVVTGSGRGVVVGTGANTEAGFLQDMMLDVIAPGTPLERQIDLLGKRLVGWSTLACLAFTGIGIGRGIRIGTLIKSAISLGIAAIPEGLPTVATTTLTLGIREMKRQNVLIRHLKAVETLGAIKVLCLDKTGTLTLNKMKAVAVRTTNWSLNISDGKWMDSEAHGFTAQTHPDLWMLLKMVGLCSDVRINTSDQGLIQLEGSPTECALVDMAYLAGADVQSWRNENPRVRILPRTSDQPYMTSLHETTDTKDYLIAVKGSPESVLDLCSHWVSNTMAHPMDESTREKILAANHDLAGMSLRVLGVAFKRTKHLDDAPAQGLVWVGLIALEDVLRPGIQGVIQAFHEAGIQTLMLTGDQKQTAEAIGQRLGLEHFGNRSPLSSRLSESSAIFSRVSPEEKLRIIRILQESGQVIAMTGDGINDGPALKAANVGISLGLTGHSAARSVADVVLTRDDLQGVVTAVRQGRTIYRNIRKSLRFLIATNLTEIEIMFLVMLMLGREALNPMQLLWINLMTDIFPALALALEGPERDVLKEAPRNPNEEILSQKDLKGLFKESLVISTCALIPSLLSVRHRSFKAGQARSLLFFSLVSGQLLHTLSCRSEKKGCFNPHHPSNPSIKWAVAGGLLLQVFAFKSRTLSRIMALTPLTRGQILTALLSAGTSLLVNESFKTLSAGQNQGMQPKSQIDAYPKAKSLC